MTMLLCEPATTIEAERVDEATAAARTWFAKQLAFEQLLLGWRAAAGDDAAQ